MAVNPSDTAPALIALDAKFVIRSASGERIVDAQDYFIGPGTDITRMTVLQPGELLTAIRIPGTWAGAQFYVEKVADRKVWDFPLREHRLGDEDLGQDHRVGCASRSTPWRRGRCGSKRWRRFVAGKPRNEETARRRRRDGRDRRACR